MTESTTAWRKSSYSGPENNCVELAQTSTGTVIRDTKDRDGGTIAVPVSAFAALLTAVKAV
ncbi:MAG: hypothetical protein JWQ81_5086 [Amycolatopsis sp.]|jgi:hypothetical protein|uniref:DUF397 domain-containing protein n=1 Tax=Amycolatopsis sp. TaxID=37632 RepID=UPI0026355E6F|nr:DUF397 domain-containing protein [Amycolatopsis sp.]MCU1684347.1 hypothetical protein [Amycolatopsis sp.]